jgi:hypothetical protein
MDLIPERTLPVKEAIGSSFYVRALDNDSHSIRIPIIRFFQERYRGIAMTTTNPNLAIVSQIGDWFHCGETGRFTYFNNQEANEFDRFYYNGTTWDLLPFSELWSTNFNYLTLKETDPAGVPTPEVGYVQFGVYEEKPWIKDSEGNVIYTTASVNSQEIEATVDGQTEFEIDQVCTPKSLVFHNGSLLKKADWNAGMDISDNLILTLVNPAYAGDSIQILF